MYIYIIHIYIVKKWTKMSQQIPEKLYFLGAALYTEQNDMLPEDKTKLYLETDQKNT